MSCCGRQRELLSASAPSRAPHAAGPAPVTSPARPAAGGNALFEYVGRTALSVVGPVTGLHYRFDRPGSRLPVHPADGAAMTGIPSLRRLTGRG